MCDHDSSPFEFPILILYKKVSTRPMAVIVAVVIILKLGKKIY